MELEETTDLHACCVSRLLKMTNQRPTRAKGYSYSFLSNTLSVTNSNRINLSNVSVIVFLSSNLTVCCMYVNFNSPNSDLESMRKQIVMFAIVKQYCANLQTEYAPTRTIVTVPSVLRNFFYNCFSPINGMTFYIVINSLF